MKGMIKAKAVRLRKTVAATRAGGAVFRHAGLFRRGFFFAAHGLARPAEVGVQDLKGALHGRHLLVHALHLRLQPLLPLELDPSVPQHHVELLLQRVRLQSRLLELVLVHLLHILRVRGPRFRQAPVHLPLVLVSVLDQQGLRLEPVLPRRSGFARVDPLLVKLPGLGLDLFRPPLQEPGPRRPPAVQVRVRLGPLLLDEVVRLVQRPPLHEREVRQNGERRPVDPSSAVHVDLVTRLQQQGEDPDGLRDHLRLVPVIKVPDRNVNHLDANVPALGPDPRVVDAQGLEARVGLEAEYRRAARSLLDRLHVSRP
mmetsp:Transcript_3392/g.9474  ORF Transcript_3392/g.9474 Transcript_3392/m.9474 type:complete len:313 (-) Transcript_3392:175-1113(-)